MRLLLDGADYGGGYSEKAVLDLLQNVARIEFGIYATYYLWDSMDGTWVGAAKLEPETELEGMIFCDLFGV